MSQYGSFAVRGGLGPVNTLTGNIGGAVSPDGSGNINVVGSGVISVSGNPGTHTLTITGTGSIPSSFATDSGTAVPSGGVITFHGVSPLTTSGSGSTVSISIGSVIPIADGGTNATSMSNTDGVVYFDGTRLVTTAVGTAAQVLTSNGAGVAPTFQNATGGGISTLAADSGSATGSTVTISGGTTGLTTSASAATMNLTGTLVVGNGGTGATTFTSHGVLLGNTTGAITATANGTTGQLFTATTGSAPGWANAPASSISITGDSGGALTGASFTFTASGIGLSFAGAGSTETLGGTLKLANGGTNANLTANNGGIFYSTASAGAILSGTATARQMLQSGASTTPAWSTATYPATTTINQLLYSSASNVVGGVTAGNFGVLISSSSGVPSWLANGTTGQVLTATTSGTPTWQAASGGGITTINGDSGSVTGSTVTIATNQASSACGNTVQFTGSASTLLLTVTDGSSNTAIGQGAGSGLGGGGLYNTFLGLNAGANVTGNFNTCVGRNAEANATGTDNVLMGFNAFIGNSGAGSQNVAIGSQIGTDIGAGSYNVWLGYTTASSAASGNGSNVYINSAGANESNVLRIGAATGNSAQNLNKAFICGITGITVTGTAVLVSTGNQLGVAVSSRKYKNNIRPMSDHSAHIYALKPAIFEYNEVPGEDQIGLIAEEVAEIYPNLVVRDQNGDPQTVKYHELPSLLLNELIKLRQRVQDLEDFLEVS